VPTPWLDGKHQVFGKVLEGMDLVEAISHIEVDKSDRPVLPIIIRDVGEIKLNGGGALPTPAQTVAAAAVPEAAEAAPVPPAAPAVEQKLESGTVAAAGAGEPAVTKYIYFDLQQDGVDLGRLLFGL
jgi:hypothetical protein